MGWGGPGKRPGVRAVWLKSLPEQSEPDVGDKEAALREEPFPLHMPSWLTLLTMPSTTEDKDFWPPMEQRSQIHHEACVKPLNPKQGKVC